MFYEGTEKRLLICTKSLNLFNFNDHFWQKLVAESGAEILSHIHNAQLKAYLLSESSLFVWQDKLLLITCGNTQLFKAALFAQQQFTKQQINTLIFQRHQALKPQLQTSNFQQDTLQLEKQFNGQQQHWRDGYQGDLFVFGKISKDSIATQNIYMLHGLSSSLAIRLQTECLNKQEVLDRLKLTRFFDGLIIDHFSFNPTGYSLNAICNEDYLTIHLTPERLSTYLSIETSFTTSQCTEFIAHLEQLFLPSNIKQLNFKPDNEQLNINIF